MSKSGGVSRDDVFDLLSSHRRRYALHACKQLETPVELSELAEQVAAWENDKSRREITSNERHRVYTSMQQTHLPAMERADIIDFDDRTVELTDRADDLNVYMDIVPDQSIPWGQYYLGLSAFSIALVASVWVGVYPASIPDLAWAALIAVLFLASATYHVWQSRRMRLGSGDTPPGVNK